MLDNNQSHLTKLEYIPIFEIIKSVTLQFT